MFVNEIWKDVVEFEDLYQVSNLGNVKSVKRRILLKPDFDKDGYRSVRLYKKGKAIAKKVHRLVLETFVGPCPEGQICRHFPDFSTSNNFIENLQWGTKSKNEKDKIIHGTSSVSKLTIDIVKKIRLNKEGKTVKSLAEEFGVSAYTIYGIWANRTWHGC